MNVSDFNLKL